MDGPAATARLATPIGIVTIIADEAQLIGIRIGGDARPKTPVGHRLLLEAVAQLSAWFAGQRKDFDLPLRSPDSDEGAALRAGIAAIPYGETWTYGAVASATGSIARAVGQACKMNPFPIIIPCHRVTSASGPEFYSAGSGVRTKSWLIDFEHDNLPCEQRTRLI